MDNLLAIVFATTIQLFGQAGTELVKANIGN